MWVPFLAGSSSVPDFLSPHPRERRTVCPRRAIPATPFLSGCWLGPPGECPSTLRVLPVEERDLPGPRVSVSVCVRTRAKPVWPPSGAQAPGQRQGPSVGVRTRPPGHGAVHAPSPSLVSSQIHLGPSFLQSFLSGVRARRARIARGFLQPFPRHRYERQGDTHPASQSCPSEMRQEASQGLGSGSGGGSWGAACAWAGEAVSDGADGAGAPVCSPRRWQVSPWGLSAHYSVSDHVLVFPAGLLQPPFFHPGYPRYGAMP